MKLLNLVLAAAFVSISSSAQVFTSSQRIEPIASMNLYQRSGYNDVWGYTAPDGREYALLGVQNGTSVVDITDSPNLVEVGFVPSRSSTWKDIKTYSHYAYVVNESGGGMQILDLSDLPRSVKLANTYTGFTTSHNLFIDTVRGVLFAEGDDHFDIVRIMSLADPVNPVQVAGFGVECHDIFARDNLVYVSEGGHGTIGIYDYTDITKPKIVARFGIPRAGYVHNAWLTEDSRYLMTTEETPDKTLKMWDLQDLNKVKMVGEYLAPGKLAHNTHIKGNYAYISHYGSGLRIVDISNPANPTEVAQFTKGNKDIEGFNGAWGAFPFFASGKVLMSDIETGLYVFQF